MDREALAAGGSAAVFRLMLNALAPGRSAANAEFRESARQLNSQTAQDALDNRIHLAQESNVNKRAKKQFEDFIDKVGPDEYVYIRPDVLTDIEGLPDNIVEQIDGTGANVSIPMAQFLTHIATDPSKLDAMRPHITLRDGDMSKSELDLIGDSVPEHIQKLVANAQKFEDDMVEAEQIYEHVKDQLVDTRRQGEQTAKLSAQLIPAMIVAHKAELAKSGREVSVRELYEDMNLTVVGPQPQFDDRRVYEQDLYTLVEGKVGFKDDRIDFILQENGYSDGRTKGAVAYINPVEFLGATTPSQVGQDMIRSEAEPLDQSKLQRETQTPFIDILQDPETGGWAVDGHEGRHRMQALANAGYNQVPVILRFDQPVNELPPELGEAAQLMGDTWSGETGSPINVYGATPLTFKNRDRISSEFGFASSPQIMYQSDQDFGDAQMPTRVVTDEAGNQFEVTEKFQTVWNHNQKRLKAIESLKKCLTS